MSVKMWSKGVLSTDMFPDTLRILSAPAGATMAAATPAKTMTPTCLQLPEMAGNVSVQLAVIKYVFQGTAVVLVLMGTMGNAPPQTCQSAVTPGVEVVTSARLFSNAQNAPLWNTLAGFAMAPVKADHAPLKLASAPVFNSDAAAAEALAAAAVALPCASSALS